MDELRAHTHRDWLHSAAKALRRGGAVIIDAVLPPRCAGCAMVVVGDSGFCSDCWQQLDFLAGRLCDRCGVPIEIDPSVAGGRASDGLLCGGCIAEPPPYARARAPLAYGRLSRQIVMRLKYGRRTGTARLIARLMAPLLADYLRDTARPERAIVVPVPLHRWRLWTRGFNQSAEIARHLCKASATPLGVDVLERRRRTPPLRGLGRKARERTVAGAFTVPADRRAMIAGARVILIDDVLTSGATARACCRTLLRAGAADVRILAFARVLDRPDPGMPQSAALGSSAVDSGWSGFDS